ncbi:MAG: hypothetical protein HYY45_07975 [Deltaproteobacteria bacterium]|nr:hypothetical protein [Deltaproteobacteria bacterium]
MDIQVIALIMLFLVALGEIAGFTLMVLNHREIVRMTRAVAGLIVQENDKTRNLVQEALSRS